SPMTATLCATMVLRAAGATAWLERIVAGEAATLAVTNADGSWEPGDTDVAARPAGDGVVLDGAASFVQDARKASVFVVSASGPGGVGLYAVPAAAPGVTVAPDRIVDLTRDQATVRFAGVAVPASGVVAPAGRGVAALDAATPGLLTIVAADLCGAA